WRRVDTAASFVNPLPVYEQVEGWQSRPLVSTSLGGDSLNSLGSHGGEVADSMIEAGLRARSRHGPSTPPPSLASGAATAWPNRCRGWAGAAPPLGLRRRVENRSYSTHDTMRAVGVSPPHLCRGS